MYVGSLLRFQFFRDWFEVDQSGFVESNMLFECHLCRRPLCRTAAGA